MHCTHCRKQFSSVEAANRWPLSNSAHSLWPHTPLPVSTSATRLLGSYASLWSTHQSICDLLTNLSHHASTPACLCPRGYAPEGTQANEGYEINFYSAGELVSTCNTVVQKLRQTQDSCDLNASFVVCLKSGGAEIFCLSDFLGATAFSRNSTSVATMYANPLYTHPLAGQFVFETRLPNATTQESSTDTEYFVPMESSSNEADYIVAMPAAAASAQSVVNRDWSGYSGQAMPTSNRDWPSYSGQAAAPNVQAEALYYSTVAEQKNGLFEELARKYEQFIVVFAHQSKTAVANLSIPHKRSWRRPVYLALSVMAAMATIAAAVVVTRRSAGSQSLAFSETCYPASFSPQHLPTMFNRTGVDIETQEVMVALTNVTTEMVNCAINAPLNVRAPSFTLNWPHVSTSWQRTVAMNLTAIALRLMPDEIPPWYFNLTSLCIWCATDTAFLLDAAIAQNHVRVANDTSTASWSLQLANALCVNLLTNALARQGHLPNATGSDYGSLLNSTLLSFNAAFANSTLISSQGTRQHLPSFMYNLGLSIYTRIMEKAPSYNTSSLFNFSTTTVTPSTSTQSTTTLTTTTTPPAQPPPPPCCPVNVCLPYPFANCLCQGGAWAAGCQGPPLHARCLAC